MIRPTGSRKRRFRAAFSVWNEPHGLRAAIHTRSHAKTPPANPASDASRSQTWAAVVTLALVALLTFDNAAPDALVFDDKAFAGPEPMIQLERLANAFTDDLRRHDHAGGL